MENKKIKVYLAGGWFDEYQDKALSYLESYLFSLNKFEVYAPRKEIVLESAATTEIQDFVFNENCKHIINSDLVIASTVGKDMGTIWETGYAFANSKPIIYTLFDERFKDVNFNLMLAASGIAAFVDKIEFEEFIESINKENLNILKKRYKGAIE